MQLDAAVDRPAEHRERYHFGAVVHHDGLGVASQLGDRIEHPGHSFTGEREVGFEGKIFACAIVANGKDAKPAIVPQAVMHEIEGPPLVRRAHRIFDGPPTQGQLTPNALTDLEMRRTVDSPNPLVIVGDALATQQNG